MSMVAGPEAIEAVVALARTSGATAGMSCKVIAIDGQGGAGKSTLAARTASYLDDAPVIHTDDFASWQNPLDWWSRLLEQVLLPMSRGESARYQRYDWDNQRLAEWHEVPPTAGYLVIEGVTATRREFRPHLAVKVWVSTARQECLRRGLARDGPAAAGMWAQWQAAEADYIEQHRPEQEADLVVSGEHGQPWTGQASG